MAPGSGVTRPVPRDGGVEELHGDPKVKNGRSAKDCAPERLRCGTIEKELLKPSECSHMGRGLWPNRHITFIVAEKV